MEPICYLENDENDFILLNVAFRKINRPDCVRWFRTARSFRETLLASEPFELPKVILLDLNLDCESGLDCLNWLATQPALSGIPSFIFSSGRIAEEIALSLHRAAGYIFKPSRTFAAGLKLRHPSRNSWIRKAPLRSTSIPSSAR